MRMLGLVGLVLALLVVALVAKKQIGGSVAATAGVVSAPADATPQQQVQRVQQQVQDALEAGAKARKNADDN